MKKVILAEQLDLSTEIIANLSDEQLQEIEGGEGDIGAAALTTCFYASCKSQVQEQSE